MFSVSNTNDFGAGSFRQALLDANAAPGQDSITFSISGTPPFVISPKSLLPTVTDPVVIDGSSQPGFSTVPLVWLDGPVAGAGVNGLTLLAGNSTVRSLIITRFSADGIRIEGAGSNVVEGNFIGIGFSGIGDLGNGEGGITIYRSSDNRIGGTNAAARNVISGGNLTGIYVIDGLATRNQILGNFIGTDLSGTVRRGNRQNGILLSEAPGNIIGGPGLATCNLLSGNTMSGLYLLGAGASNNLVRGNYIGTSITGYLALSNGIDGITLSAACNNLIGGAEPGAGNVISGNGERGIYILMNGCQNVVQGNRIGTDPTGALRVGNLANGIAIFGGSSNRIGGNVPTLRNLISGNQQSGLLLLGTNTVQNFVHGNFIGVNDAGTAQLSNAFNGINISGAPGNWIGGDLPGEGNLLSANGWAGIFVGSNTATGNRIQGNRIGTDAQGQFALGNQTAGIWIESPGNWFGGNTPGARNLVSANQQSGFFFLGTDATNNHVLGNFIGVNGLGTKALGNRFGGVGITNAPGNFIGGPSAGEGNLISGNLASGIFVQGLNSTNNWFQGNRIGTDLSGTAAVPNGVGGIYFYSAGRNVIGGTNVGAGNLISGNAKVGIAIGDPGANQNLVQGNWIGVAADGHSPLGNEFHGIEILNTSSNNIIGGMQMGAANRIAYAKTVYAGVRVRDGCSRNSVRGNVIFSNGALGIDLGANGVNTPSTPGNWQKFPVLVVAAGRYLTTVQGTFSGVANKSYTLDFYSSPEKDSSGNGEGFQWLGATNVTAAANGVGVFTARFTNAIPIGRFLSATATDATNNTSEFSAWFELPDTSVSDSDGDGMSDEFEIVAGFNPLVSSDAILDADNDGMNNRAEFFAGTDPRDAASLLYLEFAFSAGTGVQLSFPTVAERHYSIEVSDDLSAGWNPLASATNLIGNGFPIRVEDETALNPDNRFYRVRVSP